MNAMETVIESVKLKKSFGSNHVLRDFDFKLQRGENAVILGKSGSGKSVFIKCVIGLMKQDAGTLKVFGEEVSDLGQEELDRMRTKVGFLFQSNALYDSMTVRENLEFPLRRHWIKMKKEEVNALVMEALTNVGLAETVDLMPAELSGGMRKRIALARTLILKPEIILYDEPTTGLDPITGREISNLMVEIQKKYRTSSVIISHDLNCVKITSNKVIMLVDGKNYAEGSLEELKLNPDPVIRSYFELA